MKKIMFTAVLFAVFAGNACAYFDGGASMVTGPDGYRGTRLNLVLGSGSLALEPSIASYSSDGLDKTLRTYALRGALETEKYTLGAEAGSTPKSDGYSNKFFGGDVTVSLTPGSGGKSRLAGPGSRSAVRGGQGVTRIDLGAGLKYTAHEQTTSGVNQKTGQTAASVFAGAKILMANLSASYTNFSYGSDKAAPRLENVSGHNFALSGVFPKSSVNARLDLPGYPMVTPFVSYTGVKYKRGVDDSSAYLFGAYIDLGMVSANIGYQIFDSGSARDSYLSVGAGIKF